MDVNTFRVSGTADNTFCCKRCLRRGITLLSNGYCKRCDESLFVVKL